MNTPIKVPPLGESVYQATIVRWLKPLDSHVEAEEAILEIETEKVTLEIYTPCAGYLSAQYAQTNDTVKVGDILGEISASKAEHVVKAYQDLTHIRAPSTAKTRQKTRQPLSHVRQRIANRLKQAQNTAAILTTFNEVDMSWLMELRQKHMDDFRARWGVKLGYLSSFVKICTQALQEFPLLNSYIDGQDVVTPNYQDISVAISADDGLVVPVISNCQDLSLGEIETKIVDFSNRAQQNALHPDEMQGGTFTVSNGGVYGSLWSTPILNPPQSAILGLHKIEQRPVVVDNQIVIKPMMYLALSYDHRLIDGQQAVQFLVKIKTLAESVEDNFVS